MAVDEAEEDRDLGKWEVNFVWLAWHVFFLKKLLLFEFIISLLHLSFLFFPFFRPSHTSLFHFYAFRTGFSPSVCACDVQGRVYLGFPVFPATILFLSPAGCLSPTPCLQAQIVCPFLPSFHCENFPAGSFLQFYLLCFSVPPFQISFSQYFYVFIELSCHLVHYLYYFIQLFVSLDTLSSLSGVLRHQPSLGAVTQV